MFWTIKYLNRKISKLGQQVAYREDATFSRFVRQTVALAFVPLQFVRLAWQPIKMSVPNLPRVDEFISYFEATWLVDNFSPRLWNVYETDSGSPRTNKVGLTNSSVWPEKHTQMFQINKIPFSVE